MRRPSPTLLAVLVASGLAAAMPPALSANVPAARPRIGPIPFDLPLLWPPEQRAFVQDGAAYLFPDDRLAPLLDHDDVGRIAVISSLLADPLPATPENELLTGIERRRSLVRREHAGFLDDRARLLFLRGEPLSRSVVDCAETFAPIEMWAYPRPSGSEIVLVLYRPGPAQPYRLWRPIDSKRVLYNPEMEYYLEQIEELKRYIRGKRFDLQTCDKAEEIDRVTGVDGLFGFRPNRPKNEEIEAFLAPPADLAAWATAAIATPVEPPASLAGHLELLFPDVESQRLRTRFLIVIPPEAPLGLVEENEKKELRLRVEGQLEKDGRVFETFRLRFLFSPPDPGVPRALAVERLLRPQQEFLVRLKVVDEVDGSTLYLDHGFRVPAAAEPDRQPSVPETAIVSLTEHLQEAGIAGRDSLILVPPAEDVVFGLFRAEALVTGSRIAKVVFLLDGEKILSRRNPPFTAELRLPPFPREQIVRAEGYDDKDVLVTADEIVINQPRGELRVRIVEPARGRKASGRVTVRLEIVVPEEKRVASVELRVNDRPVATLTHPPWEGAVDVPAGGDITYLTAIAVLDDGLRAEDVRFLNAPDYIEEVDVDLVELFTTVTDRDGRLVPGLTAADFAVAEDGRPQKVSKLELVENLPLTIGITIDTSGSMFSSLGEAQRAATDFLRAIVGPQDRTFAVAFSDRPLLLMERTSDVGAVEKSLLDLQAFGATALHDAVVTSLYYFRGIRGRRALVLLSDGEDTSSSLEFDQALEYSRRSGVTVYAIGLGIGRADLSVRRKLEALTRETGGRTFYIKEAVELSSAYAEIERELRSQYLVAYASDSVRDRAEWRAVTLQVRGGKLKARTLAGYYP